MPLRIGVAVPVHNRRALVSLTLDSLLCQAGDLRVVIAVVDDGSTDGTYEHLLGRYAEQLLRVEDRLSGEVCDLSPAGSVLLIRQPNQHVSAARGAGLRALYQIGCDAFSHQDSDDLALPWKLQALAETLREASGAGLAHGRSQDISPEGFLLPEGAGDHERPFASHRPGGSLWERARRGGFRPGDLGKVNYIHNQTVLYTRGALEAVGLEDLYRPDLRYGEDWDLHQRMERAGVRLAFCDRYVALSRLSPGGLSARQAKAPISPISPTSIEELIARRDRLMGAGQLVDAYQAAAQVAARQQTNESEAVLAEARQRLVELLCQAREQARDKGQRGAALSYARQVFALSPCAAAAAALVELSATF